MVSMKQDHKYLLTLACFAVLLTSIYFCKECDTTQGQKVVKTAYIASDNDEYRLNYFRCVENIMLAEGFCQYPYACPAGHPTIGFGHMIQPKDKFRYPMSFHTAYQLLLSDFNGSIAYARELGYVRENNQQLAVAHAIFCLGVGTVGKLVKSGFRRNVLKYCKYKRGNQWIKSEYIRKSRQFELNLYNK